MGPILGLVESPAAGLSTEPAAQGSPQLPFDAGSPSKGPAARDRAMIGSGRCLPFIFY
jgi:hypothetical protein